MCNNTPDFDHHKIMFAKIYAFAIILFVLLVTVNANAIEERQGVDSIVNSVTSDIGSVVSQATSIVGSVGGAVFSTVTSIGGSLATVITSEGGQAITLAGSGAGIVTSFAGSEYTVATAAAVSAASAHSNAAMGVHSFGITKSIVTGLASVAGGVLFGAWLTL